MSKRISWAVNFLRSINCMIFIIVSLANRGNLSLAEHGFDLRIVDKFSVFSLIVTIRIISIQLQVRRDSRPWMADRPDVWMGKHSWNYYVERFSDFVFRQPTMHLLRDLYLRDSMCIGIKSAFQLWNIKFMLGKSCRNYFTFIKESHVVWCYWH